MYLMVTWNETKGLLWKETADAEIAGKHPKGIFSWVFFRESGRLVREIK